LDATVNALEVNCGDTTGTYIGMYPATFDNAGAFSVLSTYTFMPPRWATGLIAANIVPAGSMFYDSTLERPFWTDGAAWKDAAGTLGGSTTYDPGNIAAGTFATTTVTVTGATLYNHASAHFDQANLLGSGILVTAQVTAADTVTVTLFNMDSSDHDLAQGTLGVRVYP
jgi:hypothetical protein